MSDYVLIIIRSFISFILLLFLTRIMGKKQLSQMSFFDYVVGITIGSIAASMSVDKNVQISNGLISLAIWGLIPIAISYIGLKSRTFLTITDGRASVIIKNGKILEKEMKKNQLAIEELMMLLREKSVFKVEDVQMAVLETNGELSIMKKSELEPLTPQSLGLKLQSERSPYLIIVDGHVLHKNLETAGYTEGWLQKELKKQGVAKADEVFLAQVDSKGSLFVDKYEDKLPPKK